MHAPMPNSRKSISNVICSLSAEKKFLLSGTILRCCIACLANFMQRSSTKIFSGFTTSNALPDFTKLSGLSNTQTSHKHCKQGKKLSKISFARFNKMANVYLLVRQLPCTAKVQKSYAGYNIQVCRLLESAKVLPRQPLCQLLSILGHLLVIVSLW